MLSSVIEIDVKGSDHGQDAGGKDRLTMTALYHKIEVFRTPFAEVACRALTMAGSFIMVYQTMLLE